jgi:O-antigen ligase/polysaccharide polymerase Wzy-like membrane protein
MGSALSLLARLVVIAAVVALPLVTTSGGIDNFREPKDSILIATAALLLVLGALRFAWKPAKVSVAREDRLPLYAIGAALIWTFLSSAFATNRAVALRPLVWTCALAVFAFAALILAQRESIAAALWALVAPVINAAVFLLQRFHVWNPIRFTSDVPDHFRYTALIGNPDDASSFFVAPMIAALVLMLVTRGWRRGFSAGAVAILGAALITGRLTSIVAVAAGLLTLAIVREHKRALPVIAAVMVATLIAGFAYSPLRTRLRNIVSLVRAGDYAEATSGRITPFLAAVEMAKDHPLFGVGPHCFAWEYFPYKIQVERQHPRLARAYAHMFNFSDVHNDHLQLIAECGIAAYVLIVLGIVGIVSRAQRADGDDDRAAFARTAALPLAVSAGVLCLAHFPMHLTAPALMYVYFGALLYAWSGHAPEVVDAPRMPRAVGVLFAIVVIAGAAWVTRRFAWDPFVCEAKKLQLQARTNAALDASDAFSAAPIARDNIASAGECLTKRRGDIDLLMIRAANDRVLGNFDDARATYLEALRYDRRPELYYELGTVDLQRGHRAEGVDELFQAVLFSRTYFAGLAPDVVDDLTTRLRREAGYLGVK